MLQLQLTGAGCCLSDFVSKALPCAFKLCFHTSYMDQSCGFCLQDLQDVRHQLKAEQNKVFRLEVQLAEANEKLELMPDLEKQLNNYRCIRAEPCCEAGFSYHAHGFHPVPILFLRMAAQPAA